MKLIAAIAALGLAAAPATAQEPTYQKDPGTTNRTGGDIAPKAADASRMTRTFTTEAASGNALEVETSRLALEKSKNPDVQSFAQMMITDHTQVGEKMKAALKDAGLPPPAEKLTPKHQDMVDKLKAAAGSGKFEAQYVAVQIKAHDEAVNLFSNYAKNGDNAALKQFAEATLPSLEKHQKLANDLKAKVSGGTATQ